MSAAPPVPSASFRRRSWRFAAVESDVEGDVSGGQARTGARPESIGSRRTGPEGTVVPEDRGSGLVGAALAGLAYFACALLSVQYSRFEGGVAMVWCANAMLAAWLHVMPVRTWRATLVATGLASFLATACFGLGLALAPWLTLVNLAESALAALVVRHLTVRYWPSRMVCWMLGYGLGIGLLLPLAGALAGVGGVTLLSGTAFGANFGTWMIGHSLGLLVVLPPGAMLACKLHKGQPLLDEGGGLRAALLMIAMFTLTMAVFAQPSRPFLLFPLLLVLFSATWANALVALALPMILAMVGGFMTLNGLGPIALIAHMHGDPGLVGNPVQFLQLYLAVVVLSVLPLVAERERRQQRLRELARSEAHYRLLSDHASDVIMHLGGEGEVRYASPAIARLTGYAPGELAGSPLSRIVMPAYHEAVAGAWRAAIARPGHPVAVEYLGRCKSGDPHWLETHFRGITDEEGRVEGLVSVTRDIASRKRIEEDLAHAAMTDPLTGIPNRRAFFDMAGRLEADEDEGGPVALALIDIDFFKQVNDRYGHSVGDEVLEVFGRTAQAVVRGSDILARIGGEEFALLMPDTDIEGAQAVCRRLAAAVAGMGVETPHGVVRITVSMGLAAVAGRTDLALAAADAALYRAKSEGRARLRVAA